MGILCKNLWCWVAGGKLEGKKKKKKEKKRKEKKKKKVIKIKFESVLSISMKIIDKNS